MSEMFAQGVGIVAMVFLVLSFQMKTPKGILLLQSIGGFLFCINFFLLKQYVGSMLNLLAFVRQDSLTPVIVLSARTDETDKIAAVSRKSAYDEDRADFGVSAGDRSAECFTYLFFR